MQRGLRCSCTVTRCSTAAEVATGQGTSRNPPGSMQQRHHQLCMTRSQAAPLPVAQLWQRQRVIARQGVQPGHILSVALISAAHPVALGESSYVLRMLMSHTGMHGVAHHGQVPEVRRHRPRHVHRSPGGCCCHRCDRAADVLPGRSVEHDCQLRASAALPAAAARPCVEPGGQLQAGGGQLWRLCSSCRQEAGP